MAADPIQRVIHALSRLPSVGEKSAARMAFFLLNQDPAVTRELADALGALHAAVRLCGECANLSAQDPCPLCAQPRRDPRLICVVEDISSLMAIERTGVFEGRYHVLHGLLSPLDGVGPEQLRVSELLARLSRLLSAEGDWGDHGAARAGARVEVIVALPSSVNGNATSLYLQQLLRPLGVALSRIASGVPVGATLQYADQVSLAEALSARRPL
ncbi:MAG: recombination protein RecR [Deltaproteobacteria bacterium]|nr:recombination protein RecR [Deltaproteobacteria bacterium]